MTSGQTRRTAGQRRRTGGTAAERHKIAGHRAFAPLLGVWGALLGGLVIAVMPYQVVSGMLQGTLLGSWGEASQALFAAILATIVGSTMFALGMLRHHKVTSIAKPSMVELAMRQVTPINPAIDLGSRRLDDPVDAMPFSTPAWRDADLDTPRQDARPEAAPVDLAASQLAAAPGTLDLAASDELLLIDPAEAAPEPEPAPEPALAPARDAEPAPAVPHLRAVEADRPPLPGTAALARLRSTPPEALSLAEMVERFAAALHEHRETPPTDLPGAADLAAREAALAEALKALAALSGGAGAARAATGNGALRAKLTQAHPRRGVG